MSAGAYDVAVVGSRVAGASTALLLARAGVRVAVLDRARRGSDTVSTHALMRAGVNQVSRWGILPALRAAGTPPVRRTLFHYPGKTVSVTIKPSPGVDALYAPRRTVIDSVLLDAAADAGAHVHDRTAVVGFVLDSSGRVTGVRTRTAAGASQVVNARLVIGADGLRSPLASAVGAQVQRRARWTSAVLYSYRSDMPAAGYEWAYGPGTAAGMIPTNDGLVCLFTSTTPAGVRALRRQGAEAALRSLFVRAAADHADRFDESSPVGPIHMWSGAAGFVRRSWGPGWALVGDAGYFKDPITTHGMTDALRDAELLARAVLDSLAGDVPEDVALASYQRRRDSLSERLFDVTETVASYDWSLDEIPGLLREVSSAMNDEVEFLEELDDLPHAQQDPRPVAASHVE